MKKTIFYVTIVMSALMIVVEVNALAILPYLIALFLMYQDIYQKINREIPIAVIAIIMFFLNLFLGLTEDLTALIDALIWGIIAFTFRKKG